ncbi:ORF6N domain-containing protein, partial [Yersinia enterocolitica]|uniref:ORF6N domain-containing protein n=1 Tax=Yersinia enterocolitica TaxID=630 RepID=UPI001F56B69F
MSSIDTLKPILHNQIPVITTELLAQLYGTDVSNIKMNYSRNQTRFKDGKHYFKLVGDELRTFKHKVTESYLVATRAKHLILWTERGAARHAKMLETDQAWEVFEKLEDCY